MTLSPDLLKASQILEELYNFSNWEAETDLPDREFALLVETAALRHPRELSKRGVRAPMVSMTPSQKNAKAALKRRLRRSVRDLFYSAKLLREACGLYDEQQIRFKPQDFREIFDADLLAGIIGTCGEALGRLFADRILQELRSVYSAQGEQLMVQRPL
jgi:hypothetical protein